MRNSVLLVVLTINGRLRAGGAAGPVLSEAARARIQSADEAGHAAGRRQGEAQRTCDVARAGHRRWQLRLVLRAGAGGTKYERRMYPDSATWFAVLEGEIRFEVEKADRTFEIINATKGSYVFVPERLLHSLEVIGSAPAIRYEVTLGPASTPVFEKKPATAPKGVEYVPVTLSTGLNPLDVYNEGNGGKPWPYHVNVYELAKSNATKKNFTQEAIRANRARGNFICGYRPRRFRPTRAIAGICTPTPPKPGSSCSASCAGYSKAMRRPRSSRSRATSSTRCRARFTRRSSGARKV